MKVKDVILIYQIIHDRMDEVDNEIKSLDSKMEALTMNYSCELSEEDRLKYEVSKFDLLEERKKYSSVLEAFLEI